MSKHLQFLLIMSLAITPLKASIDNIIDSNCRAFWGSSSKDVEMCISSWKEAEQWSDVHVPDGAEPLLELNTGTPFKPLISDADISNEVLVPIKEICTREDFSPQNLKRTEDCNKRNLLKYKKWWMPQIVGYIFRQNNNVGNWLHIKEGGELLGFLPLTDEPEKGLSMAGAWEINDANENFVSLTIYAGQAQCAFDISKKSNLYWFNQTSRNYSNICPSILMARYADLSK